MVRVFIYGNCCIISLHFYCLFLRVLTCVCDILTSVYSQVICYVQCHLCAVYLLIYFNMTRLVDVICVFLLTVKSFKCVTLQYIVILTCIIVVHVFSFHLNYHNFFLLHIGHESVVRGENFFECHFCESTFSKLHVLP